MESAHGRLERCADPRGEVAKNYRVPGFAGTVSFITSMTKSFCAGETGSTVLGSTALQHSVAVQPYAPSGASCLPCSRSHSPALPSSATNHPPPDCNRLRVMADGNLKVCLFGASEVSLRDAMREGASDGDLRAIVSAAVDRKKAAHAGMFELAATANRAMVKIGG